MRQGDRLRDGWTVVIPFYNEEAFIGAALSSLAAQRRAPDQFILVDNASTDASADVVRRFAVENPTCKVLILEETAPGKVAALTRGVEAVETEFVALCDADTHYPKDYIARADALLRRRNAVAALAFGVYGDMSAARAAFLRWKGRIAALAMPRQAHSGGYGQAFRTDALRAAGGFSRERWPFLVADHEIIHRMQKQGDIAYSAQHYCITSPRRQDRKRIDWTLGERLLYHVTPNARKDWFFYRFLAGRFAARAMYNTNLRRRDWEAPKA